MHMLTSRTAETGATIRTVAVVGLGYIGLPTAAILATNGLEVIGVDVNQSTVDAVNNGDVPFVEPDLGIHVAGAVSQGRLRAQVETPGADAYIVAVPTPVQCGQVRGHVLHCSRRPGHRTPAKRR